MSLHNYLCIDGIAGSGKSTLAKWFKPWALEQKFKVFDMLAFETAYGRPPTFEDAKEADILCVYEPTKAWVGAALRQELFRLDQGYTGQTLAEAFSLDRLILFKRLIIPALTAGKTVFSERCVSSSIAYQPLMQNGPSLEHLLTLEGNALALSHSPTDLIIASIPIPVAMKRLESRDELSRGNVGEPALLEQVSATFHSDWFTQLYEKQGTRLHYFSTNVPLDTMHANACALFSSLLLP